MNEKREPLLDEEPKHKKKSKSKGQPRADHKHVYETVLLTVPHRYHMDQVRTFIHLQPTEVCTICGRINGIDWDPSYYNEKNPLSASMKDNGKGLTDKAFNLPKWKVDDFMDKFATPINEENE